MCPICLRRFYLWSLIGPDRRLTEEHVPPKSQGGSVLALTCRACNVQGGYELDAEVHKRERIHRFRRALAGEDVSVTEVARFEVDGVSATATVTVAGGGVLVEGRPEDSHPDDVERQTQTFEDAADIGSNDLSLQISPLVQADTKKARVGDLRTAYLVTFAALGYGYILQSDLDPVRRQIRNPKKEILSRFTVRLGENADPDTRGAGLMRTPYPCVTVRLGRRLIVLPPLDSDGSFWEEDRSGEHVSFQGDVIPWPLTLRMDLDFQGD